MTRPREQGFTLVELLMAVAVMSLISAAAAGLLFVCLQAHAHGTSKSALYSEGLIAMERMTSGVRNCTYLLIPNGHAPTRDILAFSGAVNDDGDFYFDDPLFPRIDEDADSEMSDDGKPGIRDVDDDGDGLIDEGGSKDDDEDETDAGGELDGDRLDGLDNDGDGNIDEDLDDDATADGKPGIAGMDDDGDGMVDGHVTGWKDGEPDTWKDHVEDDDEDGEEDEDPLNPVVYEFDGESNTLSEVHADGLNVALSKHVTAFTTTYEAPEATHAPRITISLTLTGDDGESITFSEYVYPRNIIQKTGKKVR